MELNQVQIGKIGTTTILSGGLFDGKRWGNLLEFKVAPVLLVFVIGVAVRSRKARELTESKLVNGDRQNSWKIVAATRRQSWNTCRPIFCGLRRNSCGLSRNFDGCQLKFVKSEISPFNTIFVLAEDWLVDKMCQNFLVLFFYCYWDCRIFCLYHSGARSIKNWDFKTEWLGNKEKINKLNVDTIVQIYPFVQKKQYLQGVFIEFKHHKINV